MSHAADRPPEPVRRRWPTDVVLPLVIAVLGGLVAWWRLDARTRSTTWAEDGRVFFSEREELGSWDSLFHVYAGYLHLVPRLLTDAAYAFAPLDMYALVVSALSCAVLGVISALVFCCSKGIVDSVPVRVAIAFTTVLVPAGPIETTGNMANLHWYFLWLTPWMLLARPTRWRYSVVLAVVALLAGLTEIQVALFLPLVLFRLRDRRVWPVAGGLAVGVAAQVVATLSDPRPRPDAGIPGVVDQLQGYLLNVVVPIWKPSIHGAGSLLADHGWWVAILLAVPFLLVGVAFVVLAIPMVRRPVDARLALIVAVVLGATGPFVGAMVLNPSPTLAYHSFSLVELSQRMPIRYGVVPAIFLIAGVLILVDLWRKDRRWKVVAGGVLVVLVVAVQLWHVVPDGTRRSGGPPWKDEVAVAQQACREGETPPLVRAAPIAYWFVPIGCDRLLDR